MDVLFNGAPGIGLEKHYEYNFCFILLIIPVHTAKFNVCVKIQPIMAVDELTDVDIKGRESCNQSTVCICILVCK